MRMETCILLLAACLLWCVVETGRDVVSNGHFVVVIAFSLIIACLCFKFANRLKHSFLFTHRFGFIEYARVY